MEIIYTGPKDILNVYEIHFINKYNTYNEGYNTRRGNVKKITKYKAITIMGKWKEYISKEFK